MSGDELVVTLASIVLGPIAWIVWFWRLAHIECVVPGRTGRLIVGAVVPLCAAIIFAVILIGGSSDVRHAPHYLVMYVALGLAWLRGAEYALRYAGFTVRDDVVERGNGASLATAVGAFVGVTACYAGGNVGNGPGWWVVLFCAALATAGLAAAWIALDRAGGVVDVITIDRDLAAGWRSGGFLVATGVVLGRAVAGDWTGIGATVIDFAQVVWPLLLLGGVAVLVERIARPPVARPAAPTGVFGVLPALGYLGAAVAYVVHLGWPA
jgi:hypothetical protein